MANKISELTRNKILMLGRGGKKPTTIAWLVNVTVTTVLFYLHPERRTENRGRIKRWQEEHPDYLRSWYVKNSEHVKDYQRNYARQHAGATSDGRKVCGLNRPPMPDCCELCKKNHQRLHFHHWSDKDMNAGVWVDPKCHRFSEAVDQGLLQHIEQYRILKAERTNGQHA